MREVWQVVVFGNLNDIRWEQYPQYGTGQETHDALKGAFISPTLGVYKKYATTKNAVMFSLLCT